MKKLFTHESKDAITASALVKLTTPSGDVGPRIYLNLHKVEPSIEWEILCEGQCIGIGCIKPTI